MSTTYILHGGETSKESESNSRFFKEFTANSQKQEIKILMCYWARKIEDWERLFARDLAKITEQTTKTVVCELTQNPKDLLEKLYDFDVLYVAGGDAFRIEPLYKDLQDLKTLLAGKVFVGSSMGAFLASENYVLSLTGQNETEVHHGLGLLPINTLCHWDPEKFKTRKLQLLSESAANLTILTLDEGQFAKFVH